MANVHVVTDSAAALPRGVVQDLAITVIAETVTLDGRAFHAGGNLGDPDFYEALRVAPAPIAVNPLAPAEFADAYRRVLGWGVEIVSLHPPAWLSPSAAAARSAAAALPDGSPIRVVETPWVAAGLGMACVQAARAGQDAAAIDDVLAWLPPRNAPMTILVVCGDLAFARRHGRLPIGDASAAMPGATHALFGLEDGRLSPIGPPANIATALRALVDAAARAIGDAGTAHVALWSAGADAEAAAVATFIETRHAPAEVWLAPADPHLAVLGGPGSFGLAAYAPREG